MAKSILVFAERRDGELKRPALEAISTARRLADAQGNDGAAVEVVAMGTGAASHAELVYVPRVYMDYTVHANNRVGTDFTRHYEGAMMALASAARQNVSASAVMAVLRQPVVVSGRACPCRPRPA